MRYRCLCATMMSYWSCCRKLRSKSLGVEVLLSQMGWETLTSSAKEMALRRILIAMALFLGSTPLFGQSADQHADWPGKGRLFVGTCYQPVDRSREQIRQDIALMKQAGFTMVRMGDLSWDAFEPSEGQFEFAWFDQILEQMNEAGIKVILDIGGSPAPIWLHHK